MSTPKAGNIVHVSLEDTEKAMGDILYGTQCPNVKLAFFNSMLSLQCRLPTNCRHARVIAQYANRRLPVNVLDLITVLGGKVSDNAPVITYPFGLTDLKPYVVSFPMNLMPLHIKGLYAIDEFDSKGKLNFDCGSTLESQQAWRDSMVENIFGMGSKLVSWALFIYNPFDCLLMTVDTVHCSRMGISQVKLSGSASGKREFYVEVEKMLRDECIALYPTTLPVITAACLWLNYRNEGITSHKEISCRWY